MSPRITPLDPWIARKIGCQDGQLAREALETYQLDKLRETLRLVRLKSPFYQKRVMDAPHYVSSFRDLDHFPLTTAQDICEQALQFLCVSQDEIQRVVTLDTSGTTGKPKRLYFTREDQELTIDFFHIGMSTFTEPGDKVLILLPCERVGSVGDLLAIALQRLGAQPIKHGVVRDISETLDVMSQEQVNGLVGIPTQVLALARYGEGLKLKSALLTTDHVPDAIARAVERAWGCQVYNHYGMTEMGLGGGVECQARRGYHLREADLNFEIINPTTGEPVAEGETGEVVFTTLTRRGMPLIRYRTGDISRFIPGDCPCGTTLKTLECIRQRASGYIAIGDQWQLAMADLDEALFSIASVLDFAAAISHKGAQDRLRLEVRVVEGTDSSIAGALDAALESIPAIQLARTSHQLDVVVAVQKTRSIIARPIKRIIMDRRTRA
jgi:phenylacetate-CoA ligase